jgi:hypothetical protein
MHAHVSSGHYNGSRRVLLETSQDPAEFAHLLITGIPLGKKLYTPSIYFSLLHGLINFVAGTSLEPPGRIKVHEPYLRSLRSQHPITQVIWRGACG